MKPPLPREAQASVPDPELTKGDQPQAGAGREREEKRPRTTHPLPKRYFSPSPFISHKPVFKGHRKVNDELWNFKM